MTSEKQAHLDALTNQGLDLHDVLGALDAAVIAVDLSGEIFYWSTHAREIFGWDAGEVLGRTFTDFVPKHLSEEDATRVGQILQDPKPTTLTFEVTTESGEGIHVSIRFSPIFSERDVLSGLIAVVRDVTSEHLLQQTKERHLTILNATPDFIGIVGLDGQTQFVNCGGREMLGIAPDADITGMSIPDFSPAWATEIIEQEGIPAAMREGFWQGETAFVHTDGTEIPTSQAIMVHYGEDGEPEYLSTIARDITSQKVYQQHLAEREKALAAGADGVAISDPWQEDNPITYVNEAFLELTGYTREEVVGYNCRFLQGEDREQEGVRRFRQLIEEQKEGRVLLRNYRKDGSLFWNEVSIAPVLADNGELVSFVGIQRDVSERIEMQQALFQARARDEAILQSLGEGLIVTDTEGHIENVNATFENLTGYSASEVIGKDMADVVHKQDEEGNAVPVKEMLLKRALAGEEVVADLQSAYYFTRKDGTHFPVTVSISRIELEGEILGAVEVFRDITYEKEIDTAKSEFVSLASHQLRTPLTTISWYAEMLIAGDAGEVTSEQREFLNEIYSSNNRMIGLVSALLNVSRIELGALAIDSELVAIDELIKEARKELAAPIDKKNITVIENYAPEVPELQADRRLLAIVFQNLLSNAVKYTPNDGTITVTLTPREDGGVHASIADTGFGIPEDQKDQIFNKLFRADNVRKRETDGTGLGLYITKAIVEMAGGRIWFESVEGEGTTFYIDLPPNGMQEHKDGKELLFTESGTVPDEKEQV